jgi:uncharacterized membrane protein
MRTSEDQNRTLAVERFTVQLLLRLGLAISIALMAIGLGINLTQNEITPVAVSLVQVIGPALPLGNRLLGLGVLALAMTPVLRVITLLYLWGKERDYRFMIVAAVVLVTLSLSIFLGGA